jgi:hypothetical protein
VHGQARGVRQQLAGRGRHQQRLGPGSGRQVGLGPRAEAQRERVRQRRRQRRGRHDRRAVQLEALEELRQALQQEGQHVAAQLQHAEAPAARGVLEPAAGGLEQHAGVLDEVPLAQLRGAQVGPVRGAAELGVEGVEALALRVVRQALVSAPEELRAGRRAPDQQGGLGLHQQHVEALGLGQVGVVLQRQQRPQAAGEIARLQAREGQLAAHDGVGRQAGEAALEQPAGHVRSALVGQPEAQPVEGLGVVRAGAEPLEQVGVGRRSQQAADAPGGLAGGAVGGIHGQRVQQRAEGLAHLAATDLVHRAVVELLGARGHGGRL